MDNVITISWTEIIVAIAAFWGAALSTIIFLRDLRKEKSKIRVKTNLSFLTYPNGVSDAKICVTAMNSGSVPVMLSSVHIAMPNGKNYVQVHYPCPAFKRRSADAGTAFLNKNNKQHTMNAYA